MSEQPIERFIGRLDGVRKSTTGWIACCPAHEDREPSLSLCEKDDGAVLLNCHAGCSPEAVVGALGLEMRDLFRTEGDDERRRTVQRHRQTPRAPTDWSGLAARYEHALDDHRRSSLARDLTVSPSSLREIRLGWAADRYGGAYSVPEVDGSRQVVGVSLRRQDGSKRFVAGGRRGIVVPRGLEDLPGVVLVVEGPSDVAACLSLGLPAVGRPSANQGADYIAALLGQRDVLVVAERDRKEDGSWPGRDGAKQVCLELAQALCRPVSWALPPASAKDVREWLGHRVADGLDLVNGQVCREAGLELLRELQGAAREEEPEAPEESPRSGLESGWEPFPVHVLPEIIVQLVTEGEQAIGCDPSFLSLFCLVASAGAIGLSREVRIKSRWSEPAVLWGVGLGVSGTVKSPALDLAIQPLRDLEAQARRTHAREMREYRRACHEHDQELRHAKAKPGRALPDEPEQPQLERLVVQDSTIEALARTMNGSRRASVVVIRDELSGWFRSWSEYGRGSSSAAPKWLELYGARALSVDRATSEPIYLERAAVSVVGTTQPGTLRRDLSAEHFDSGCAARILFAWPPRRKGGWRDEDVSEQTTARYANVLRRLHALEPELTMCPDGELSLRPLPIRLSPGALELYRVYVNELSEERFRLVGSEAAALSKLEGGAARIALVLELVSAAAEGREKQLADVGPEAMEAGIVLARWFAGEARRVYQLLAEQASQGELREVDELIERLGGTATPRDLRAACNRWRSPGRAQALLDEFVKAGYGRWQHGRPGRSGGRPSRWVIRLDGGARNTRTETPSDEAPGGFSTDTARVFRNSGRAGSPADADGPGRPDSNGADLEIGPRIRTPLHEPTHGGFGTGTTGPDQQQHPDLHDMEEGPPAAPDTVDGPDVAERTGGISTETHPDDASGGFGTTAVAESLFDEVIRVFDGESIPEGSTLDKAIDRALPDVSAGLPTSPDPEGSDG